MSFHLSSILTWQTFTNLLDIFVVWYIFYRLIMLVRGTKAVQLLKGIVVIILIKVISWALQMRMLSFLIDQVISWGVIALVVIFQPEIRRALEHLGRNAFLNRNKHPHKTELKMIHELDKAIDYMSKRRIGALITIQMNTGLNDYIETGIPLDADISGELLINIFIPNTPLHDGAVIIKNNRIAVAAAYLPLSNSDTIPKEFGTRHRAAVGISEVTDALTIVVSEETGGITITRNNKMMNDLTRSDYLKFLKVNLIKNDEKNNLFNKIFSSHKKINKSINSKKRRSKQ